MSCLEVAEDKIKIKSDLLREVLAEFLGTFVLITFGDASVAQSVLSEGSVGSAMSIHWSWGVAVMMGVYVSGGVSGGHINPAVTVAQACLGRCKWRKVPFYILAQYLGSFVASCLVFLVYMDALENYDINRTTVGNTSTAGIWATYPQEYVSIATCFVDQVVGTGMLLLCVMAITDDRNMGPHKGLLPICIGLVVFVIGMTFGLNCGYAINPARDLAPRIFTAIAGWGTDPFSHRGYAYFWVPVLGPHVGAVVGAYLYQLCVGFHWPTETDNVVQIKSISSTLEKENEGFGMGDSSTNVMKNSLDNRIYEQSHAL